MLTTLLCLRQWTGVISTYTDNCRNFERYMFGKSRACIRASLSDHHLHSLLVSLSPSRPSENSEYLFHSRNFQTVAVSIYRVVFGESLRGYTRLRTCIFLRIIICASMHMLLNKLDNCVFELLPELNINEGCTERAFTCGICYS